MYVRAFCATDWIARAVLICHVLVFQLLGLKVLKKGWLLSILRMQMSALVYMHLLKKQFIVYLLG